MSTDKNQKAKSRLHSRNRNKERYDLNALLESTVELKKYLKPNRYGEDSLDFANPRAVKLLNKALLHHYYGIENWDFPDTNLCPPIPGRADYLHHAADLLSGSNYGKIPKGDGIVCLDIGVGASCIYPIIGVTEYDWGFIGSDINSESLSLAQKIIDSNPSLKSRISLKHQDNPKSMFKGILDDSIKIDLSICNPPFHSSMEAAQEGTRRKVRNLSGKNQKEPILNFAGQTNELIYEGGEYSFIYNMVLESEEFSKKCLWFSTLVSKQSHLKGIYKLLDVLEVKEVKTIPMGTGNKASRIVAWSFFSKEEQFSWAKKRWK